MKDVPLQRNRDYKAVGRNEKAISHTKGQWWSMLTTQAPQLRQWWAFGGFGRLQYPQNLYPSRDFLPTNSYLPHSIRGDGPADEKAATQKLNRVLKARMAVMIPCTKNSIDIFGKRTGNVDQTPPPATKCSHQITEMAHIVQRNLFVVLSIRQICSLLRTMDLWGQPNWYMYTLLLQVWSLTYIIHVQGCIICTSM